MTALRISIGVAWIVFWVYWLLTAAQAKPGSRRRRTLPPGLIAAALVLALLRVLRRNGLAVEAPIVEVLGTILFVSGLALAVWARIHLGRNWGMPMTEKDEPELVTSGPYRLIRHPIYSGILLGLIGTALAVALYWLIVFAVMAIYFVHSARVEERLLSSSFPDTYPSYVARTKMLIPFVL